ncbi:MAG: hypothetical protein M3371_08700 [Acidobacteriota bacterium]|nr:hypothetical protein [Acidobacteriota bacterium]
MEHTSELKLEWAKREGGFAQSRRDFLDFAIDGQSLSTMLNVEESDLISCLGWFVADENTKAVRQLLLQEPADLPNNRRTLYVCPEGGDIGCGAVSLIIEQVGDKIIWRDFGYENNYEDVVHTESYEDVGPFIFDRAEYEVAIAKAL